MQLFKYSVGGPQQLKSGKHANDCVTVLAWVRHFREEVPKRTTTLLFLPSTWEWSVSLRETLKHP